MKDKHTTGIYAKFHVTRTDNSDAPGGKHDGCKYFVLDVKHDEFAETALRAYANACEGKYPVLASDILAMVDKPAWPCGHEKDSAHKESCDICRVVFW